MLRKNKAAVSYPLGNRSRVGAYQALQPARVFREVSDSRGQFRYVLEGLGARAAAAAPQERDRFPLVPPADEMVDLLLQLGVAQPEPVGAVRAGRVGHRHARAH